MVAMSVAAHTAHGDDGASCAIANAKALLSMSTKAHEKAGLNGRELAAQLSRYSD